MKRISKLFISATGMVALSLTTTAAPAYADPGDCASIPGLCDLTGTTTSKPPLQDGVDAGHELENAWPDEGGGIGDWIDQHMTMLIVIALIVIGVAVWRSATKEKAAEKTAATEADLARGRQIALDAGLSPASLSGEDLARFSAFGWAVPWIPGTALGNLVNRDGSFDRVDAAWNEAAELARLGHADEKGRFVPAATVVNVNGYGDGSGDLELSVNTRDYSVGERELSRVLEPLTRTARVETASAWTRDAVRDWHITRLSMTPAAQQAAAPEQEASAPDPTEAWEW